jgi:hypothetical protein
MSVKDYLNQIQSNKERIRQLNVIKDSIHINYDGISAIDYSGDKVQSTPKDVMFEKGCEMLEKIEEINAEIIKRTDTNTRIGFEIQQMIADDIKYNTILFERYFVGNTLADVAKNLYLDYKYVCQLHGEALRLFGKQYANKINHE